MFKAYKITLNKLKCQLESMSKGTTLQFFMPLQISKMLSQANHLFSAQLYPHQHIQSFQLLTYFSNHFPPNFSLKIHINK